MPPLGQPAPSPDPAPPAVTTERIAALLGEHGYHFTHDDDGDLTGIWDDNRMWFILGGEQHEVLQVRGRWSQTVPPERRLGLLLAVNDWNRDHLWPKVYFRDEGELAVYAEVSIDLECGVTDSQLQDMVACGLITAVQFFGELSIPEEDLP